MIVPRPTDSEDARRESVDLLIKILAAKPDLIVGSNDPAESAEQFVKAAQGIGKYIWPEYFKT